MVSLSFANALATVKSDNESSRASKEDWVLAMLHLADGKVEGAVRLTKFLFLVDRTLEERDNESPFHFIQYNYGPYDKSIFETIDGLEEDGLVESETVDIPRGEMHVYSLRDPEVGKDAYGKLGKEERRAMKDTMRAWEEASTDTIVSYIYDEYSEYAP